MQESFEVNVEPRGDLGKGANRRLRREKKMPGIVYGEAKAPQPISLSQFEMFQHLDHEAFYSHILTLKFPDHEEKVVLRDLQRHPHKEVLVHVDFQRVSASHAISMTVPLHFKGDDVAPGVKSQGGVINHVITEVTVSCLPDRLPEYIEVDLSGLHTGESIHLGELTLPEGVEIPELHLGEEHNIAVATCHKGHGGSAAEDAAAEETA